MEVDKLNKEELIALVGVITNDANIEILKGNTRVAELENMLQTVYFGVLKVIQSQVHNINHMIGDTSHLKDCYFYFGEVFYAREFIVGLTKQFLAIINNDDETLRRYQDEITKINKEINLTIKASQTKISQLETLEKRETKANATTNDKDKN